MHNPALPIALLACALLDPLSLAQSFEKNTDVKRRPPIREVEPEAPLEATPLLDRVEHHFADSGGVRIHYVTTGPEDGPLVVMLHGFPDYWYTWRHQMVALEDAYRIAAVDLRGYNKSDKPTGIEQYDMGLLVGDVAAVIHDAGRDRAIICGHDWGGAIAWSFAMSLPQMTERLMICNLPHPRGLTRELTTNAEQQRKSEYARRFQEDGAHEQLTAEGLAAWVQDDAARPHYIEAFERSDFEAMLSYYKRNYPRTTAPAGDDAPTAAAPPLASMPLTIMTVPGAGHFVQADAADLVSRTMRAWLDR
ncbi:MAG: alpha/beta fold hydrolase [Planctomycetota bacterium]|jgi:pimeloyl-ACP methyl ester carboxylesterase